jgi:hypothetical protein
LFRAVRLRRLAWALFAFGSGLGWLVALFRWSLPSGVAPADFSQLDLFGFLTLLLTPHFALTEALLWATALAFLRGWGNAPRWPGWLIGGIILAVLAQTVQVYAPLTLDIALGLYALWHWLRQRRIIWREGLSLLGLAVAQLPWAIYSFWVFQNDPGWQGYYMQNRLVALPAWDYAVGLGALGLLAVIGLRYALTRPFWGPLHLVGLWVFVIGVAVCWPSPLQRRLVAGGIGPIAILATVGLFKGLWPFIRRCLRACKLKLPHARGLVFGLSLCFMAQSNLWFLAGITASLTNHYDLYYDSAGEWEAMRWLQAHTDWQAPIFAEATLGNIIPAAIGHRVYVGHWAETPNYAARLIDSERFFQLTTPEADRYQILLASKCRYLFYGPRERRLGAFQPAQAAYLREIYHNPTVTLYEINLTSPSAP